MDDHVTTLDPLVFGGDSPCFGCSPTHPIGFHLGFERQGAVVRSRFTPGVNLQGPPGVMHGGLVMTLADEVAAWTIIGLKERFGFTASLSAKLSSPVRIGVEVLAEGTITKDAGRVLTINVELSQESKRCFVGEFNFVLLDKAGAERLLGGPIPASWEKFARSPT